MQPSAAKGGKHVYVWIAADLAVPSLMPRHLDDEISYQWTTGSMDNCLGFVIPVCQPSLMS